MMVRTVTTEEIPGGSVFRASIESSVPAADGFTIEYRFNGLDRASIDPSGNAILTALLLPSMVIGEDLVIEARVSPTLIYATEMLMGIYEQWVPGTKRIRISAPVGPDEVGGTGNGLFFSCGVDSFSTLLRDEHRGPSTPPITHLINIRGFELFHSEAILWPKMVRLLERVAHETNKTLAFVETNLRALTDPILSHGLHIMADAASVAHVLSPVLNCVQTSGAFTYTEMFDWGPEFEHPVIDPLWSSDHLRVVHSGAETTRYHKIRDDIASSPLALETLLVCNQPRTEINCSRCHKCVNTMACLEAAGALQRCATFPDHIDRELARDFYWGHRTFFLRPVLNDPMSHLTPEMERGIRRYLMKSYLHTAKDGLFNAIRSRYPRIAKALGTGLKTVRQIYRR